MFFRKGDICPSRLGYVSDTKTGRINEGGSDKMEHHEAINLVFPKAVLDLETWSDIQYCILATG